MKMRHAGLLAFTLTSVVALASANAADMYRAPEPFAGGYKDGPLGPVWTGFYAGAHVGGAWADLTAVDLNGYDGVLGDKTKLSPSGIFGGATLGYNVQRGSFVFGVEGDIGFMDLASKKALTTSAAVFAGDTSASIDSGVYGDITGRLGYLLTPGLLAYGKGGIGFFDSQFSVNDSCSTPPCGGATIHTSKSDTSTGWVAGGGVEYFVMPQWTIKAEYLHFDLGSQTVSGVSSGGPTFHFVEKDLTVDTVKAGINYHFGGDYAPLK